MRKLILPLFIATLFLSSCEPEVSFRQAQPKDAPVLTEFPAFIRGHYINEITGARLHISENGIIVMYKNDTKMHRKELDSSYKLEDTCLVNKRTGQKIPITITGDTIIQHLTGIDSIFNISSHHILKKFKGHYFLNTQFDDSTWDVKQLTLQKGELTIAHIELTTDEDIKRVKELTESPADSISKRYDPSSKKFKEFVKKGGFGSEEKYIKVK